MTEETQSIDNTMDNKSNQISENARKEYLSKVKDTKEQIKQMGTEAAQKTKQIIDEVGDYVKENPQKASLISFGMGVGLGVLLGWLTKK